MQNLGRFYTTTEFNREYVRNDSRYPKSESQLIETESEISKILFNCHNKQSDSDPIPTWLLKVCASVLTPTITNIVNLSLSPQVSSILFSKNLLSRLFSRNLL